MDIEDAHNLKLLSTADTQDLLLGFFEGEMREKIVRGLNYVPDINEQIPANRVESHFPIVVLAGLLTGLRKQNFHYFQRFFLLWLDFSMVVCHIEDMSFMNMGCCFIQMQGPVDNMNMFSKQLIEPAMIIMNHF